MPTGKAKKPAQPGKKEEKGEAKKPLQEKKAENAPAKAKKEGAPKQASAPSKKKDPATKPAAGAEAGKGKDKGKKRKLNETAQGKSKQGAPTSDSKKKKVEKKVQGKSAQKGIAKKPTKKTMSKPRSLKRPTRRRRPANRGKQEVVVFEGRRYFLLPSGKLRAMLDIKFEENDKMAKIEGAFIKRSDVKTYEDYKESIKSESATAVKRKLKLKLQILRRALMKDLLKEAKVVNKQSLATAKDAGREVQSMTLYRGTWVRKKAVPRLVTFVRSKIIKIKAARKEKGPKELTEAEQKILAKYTRRVLHEEGQRLRHSLLSKRPSVAGKQKKLGKKPKKPAKKAAPAKGKTTSSKPAADSKKQKRPAKKAAN